MKANSKENPGDGNPTYEINFGFFSHIHQSISENRRNSTPEELEEIVVATIAGHLTNYGVFGQNAINTANRWLDTANSVKGDETYARYDLAARLCFAEDMFYGFLNELKKHGY